MLIHDKLLAHLESSWDDPGPLPSGWLDSPSVAEFRDQAADFLQEEYGHTHLAVIKDPRMCRIVPFWLEVLGAWGAKPVAILPIRNPLEVAASLKLRNGITPGHSCLLWLRHVLEAERETRMIQRSIVTYEGLLAD